MTDKKNILLIDGTTFSHRSAKKWLKDFHIVCTIDADEAEKVLQNSSDKISLILLDEKVYMNNESLLAKNLDKKYEYDGIPVILLTNEEDKTTDDASYDLSGGVDTVKKPFAGSEISFRVKAHIKMKEMFDLQMKENQIQALKQILELIESTNKNQLTMAISDTEKMHKNAGSNKSFSIDDISNVRSSLNEILQNVNEMKNILKENYSNIFDDN